MIPNPPRENNSLFFMNVDEIMAVLNTRDNSVVLPCWIQPRASRNKIVGIHDGNVKISLTAPPVDGKANAELIKFISRSLKISKGSIDIISGESSRRKLLAVSSLSAKDIAEKLAV